MGLDKGSRSAFLELTPDDQAALLADLANSSANLPNATLKRARVELPSFSAVKWSEFAEESGLPEDASCLNLASFKTPRYRFPL